MVVRPSVCLRRLARGRRAAQVGFGRFLANPKVTTERLIEGWGEQTAVAVAGQARPGRPRHQRIQFQHHAEAPARARQDRQGRRPRRVVARHAGARCRHRRLPRPRRRTHLDAPRSGQGRPPEAPDRKQGIPSLDRHRRTEQARAGGGRPGDGGGRSGERHLRPMGDDAGGRFSPDQPGHARPPPRHRRGPLRRGGALRLHRETARRAAGARAETQGATGMAELALRHGRARAKRATATCRNRCR